MNWRDIGHSVARFAPLLGAAIGGPGGAAIGALVSSALGVENTPDAIGHAMSKDPQAAITLKALQATHIEKLQEMAIDKLSIELADKANARQQHSHSKMPAVIVFMLTFIVAGLIFALFMLPIPPESKDLALMMFGQVSALWGASITYWVGTTRSSAEKDRKNL